MKKLNLKFLTALFALLLSACGGSADAGISTPPFNAPTEYKLAGKLLHSSTAPVILNGFGTSPSIVSANGAAAFSVNVGSGGTASFGTLTMPTATNGWICSVDMDVPTTGARTHVYARSTTAISVENKTLASAGNTAWATGTILYFFCAAY